MKKPFSTSCFTVAFVLLSFGLFLSTSYTSPVMPVSYDMLNGGDDYYGYWDGSYSSANNKTSYVWLTGGLGDLTDGIIASGNYYTVETVEGTGPYVGWDVKVMGFYPTITFNFSDPVNIDRISIHVDNANTGRVSLPASVDISMGGLVRSFDIPFDDLNLAPRWLDFTGLALYGSSLTLTMYDRPYAYDWPGYSAGWVFVSEVTFDSGIPVLEPVTIDIKPGAFPNTINLGSRGTVPVAILTTDEFDASMVDPATVTFADTLPTKWRTLDVDSDGDKDMLLYFSIQALNLDLNSIEATLTGETADGQQIVGTDSVNIIRKGKK